MSSTKPLKEALNGKPAPQYFNPDAQEYEYLLGKYGASRQILYGPDGNPITVTGSKLAIRASEIETLVGALTAAAVTDPAASAAVIQLLKGLLKQLQGAGTGAAPVQLTGSNMELYGASINDRPAANTVPAGATFTIVDRDLDKNWISDGTNWEEV